MKRPTQAIVLAAGFGTRLLPLTLSRPKPLMPVWGKPVLRHVLELLRDWGVSDVLINLHHGAGAILDHVRLNPISGLRCSFSFEPEILGTGGALPKAAWFVDARQPFWIMNADVLGDLAPEPLLQAFSTRQAIAALWLHPDRGPRTVETREGLITTFRSAEPAAPGTATFCGLQLVSPRLLKFLPPSGFVTLVDAYEAAQKQGERVAGVTVEGAYWSDIGTPDDYRAAHRETLDRALRGERGSRFAPPRPPARRAGLTGFVGAGTGSRIAPGARVHDSVLWEGVSLRRSAHIVNAIVGDGLTVSGHVTHMALRTDRLDDAPLHEVLAALGWRADATTVLPLPPRGSARTFTRLVSGAKRAILIRYSLERPENGLYAGHAAFLRRHGLRVPRVLLNLPESHLCVMEDVGEISLQDRVPASSASRLVAMYSDVLTDVIALHGRATRAARRATLSLCEPFTRHLYEWEQTLFCEQFLARHLRPTPAQEASIRRELRRVVPALLRTPQTLVHRDLQSSNILLRRGGLALIDFQGMRFGAPAYDLASLLCDPYVQLPANVRETLLGRYVAQAPGGASTAETFWPAAVERLAQALGAYGRLGAKPETRSFLRYIPPAVNELRDAAARAGGLPCLEDVLADYARRSEPGPSLPRARQPRGRLHRP